MCHFLYSCAKVACVLIAAAVCGTNCSSQATRGRC